MMRLMWKQFNGNGMPPKFMEPKRKPGKGTGKVNLDLFINGWCPAQNMSCERARRASMEFQGRIELREFNTRDREVVKEWGIFEGLFLDGKEIRIGPPPSYEKLRKKIARKVKKIA
jgi:hypothetical protein